GNSWNFGGLEILDVAGGDLTGERPEQVAVIRQGSPAVVVSGAAGAISLPLGFQPIAVAAGAVDQSGLDSIVAVSATGAVAVCNAESRACENYQFPESVEVIDVAVGDVDGDFYEEPVFLLRAGGK